MTDDGLTTAAAAPPREEATTVDATSEPDTASGAGRPRRSRLPLPTPGDALRHAVDAVAAPLTFLVVNDTVGTRVAAVAALAVALVVAAFRRHRGEPRVVVAISATIVALHSVSALVVGEGRAFFLPEIAINVAGFALCGLSLLLARPITATVCRKLGVGGSNDSPAARRAHRRLTLGWTALWAIHLPPLLWLYAIDSVAGLTAVGTLFNKPTVLAMGIATLVVVRRVAKEEAR
ncbi:MAG: hypothetical protein CMH83_21475 [Nocardioides sp.]|nr:hypothetical protein [Nocardioides sp.]